jgi:peptide/nickel transport system permease protein
MTAFVLRRLAQGVIVIVLISLLTFFLINLAPGGPSSLVDFNTTEAQRSSLGRHLALLLTLRH